MSIGYTDESYLFLYWIISRKNVVYI